jgi:metallo-beta-lactamase family protein
LLYLIQRLKDSGSIPPVPVFLNSPMAVDATRLWIRHRDEHRLSAAQCAALHEAARIVTSPDESRELNRRKGPMVILAGSGMATGGRVLHHLKAFGPDSRNAILLTGFQAGGTRGAALLAGAKYLRIHGEDVPIRAKVDVIANLSAHADADECEQWLRGFPAPPSRTFVVHGEPAAADALRYRIEHRLGWNVCVPYFLQDCTL